LLFVVVAAFGGVGYFVGPRVLAYFYRPPVYIPPENRFQVNIHTATGGEIPQTTLLEGGSHVYQTFNNCGPAALSMALSHYGANFSQAVLGDRLRPYQVANGDNDDKSVTLEEIAAVAPEYGFVAYHRPAGSREAVKAFLAEGIPVIARTLLKPSEDIGHYRLVKGYDDDQGVFVQDDSLQGAGLAFTYDNFDQMWEAFNYEYLILVRPEDTQKAEKVLGGYLDEEFAWREALARAEAADGIFAAFNRSVAHYHLGNFEASVREYKAVADRLPKRTLWYQIEPILAYQQLGRYERVFEITTNILENGNRAFSELYQLRGEIYELEGNTEAAQEEFAKALLYNKNYNL